MTDIVERLRSADVLIVKSATDLRSVVAEEAATEIEKLRAAVQDLAKHVWRGDWDKLEPETRALLGEE